MVSPHSLWRRWEAAAQNLPDLLYHCWRCIFGTKAHETRLSLTVSPRFTAKHRSATGDQYRQAFYSSLLWAWPYVKSFTRCTSSRLWLVGFAATLANEFQECMGAWLSLTQVRIFVFRNICFRWSRSGKFIGILLNLQIFTKENNF
jgi:hypothetical protein